MEVVMGPDNIREETLCQMMTQHKNALMRLCVAYLKDTALAEDAVQETFVKAYKAMDTFRGDSSEKTWLTRIAINTCRSIRRDRWFRFVDRRVAPDALPLKTASEEDRALMEVVMNLPCRYKEAEIRRLTKFASRYENDFVQAVMGHSHQAVLEERQYREKTLKQLLARDRELDQLFERLYEDNVSGKISDERFSRMSGHYEQEQVTLAQSIKEARVQLEKCSDQSMTTDTFIATVRKYTRAKKLTPRMLNELIRRIEVHQSEKVNGVYVQRLTICYNCVGTLEFPKELPLDMPKVLMQTRKGVRLAYEPDAAKNGLYNKSWGNHKKKDK